MQRRQQKRIPTNSPYACMLYVLQCESMIQSFKKEVFHGCNLAGGSGYRLETRALPSVSSTLWHRRASLTFSVGNSNEKFTRLPWEPGSLKHIGLQLIHLGSRP